MPFGINNPLPSSMSSECKKAAKVLASFIDPRQAFGPDKVIPPQILANAKGLAILTVLKAGFLGSGRLGSGIVIARLSDGSWSAPSAIATGGGGFGGQIGFELTDFVFILNDAAAVRSFSQAGSITLGANVSIAAGPVGRNAEAAGAASLKGVAAIFSYSKTKGLFAGVSLEGSILVERRDANERLYNSRVTAQQLLGGLVPLPPAADPLMRVLNSRVFAGMGSNNGYDDMYNDVPVYGEDDGDGFGESRRGTSGRPSRANTWADDVYDTGAGRGGFGSTRSSTFASTDDDYVYRDRRSSLGSPTSPSNKAKPSRPTAPKPKFGFGDTAAAKRREALGPNRAIALYNFEADQPGDLGFKKGEIIEIVKRSDSDNDWWTGRIGDREGIFPSNYVEVV